MTTRVWLRITGGAVLAISAAFAFEAFRRWGSLHTVSSPVLTIALAYGLPLIPLAAAIIVLFPLTRAEGSPRWISRAILFFCGAAAGIFLFSGISSHIVLSLLSG
ncbi:hypothetical protein A3J43_01120 [Candidatus Uhrbacteria bacterium RIFCSPHIGHO2_12_FULL_54_23]|uniref:Uncharacterized protein n=3 Tax=Candidatus Uhriibacteriota TaxID=1752732 RepID=A0A1F7UNR6_9BACT|nr:MAG: hypothetical protein A3J43_01120 [Candidatus Uhrbacteria bacterium RIFCSPHIGHO2_12_FULL_54_23]OGL84566.1 MAG: hypothetical protein A3B36_01135 [Candidatus Uhrbacteria bacterium RIFCSPLOWO2_01_FULL_55_36]OGL90984.1 MAG: hypothetical protein A3J36_00170 [Candidatus Uhrbacteria bacterium RIFCSPLOWO2_02_FULL_54_37]